MPLEHPKRRALLGVMTSMFSTVDDFRTFLKDSLGRNADDYGVGALPTVRSRVIDRADEQEWLRELIEALKEVGGDEAKAQLDAIDVSHAFSKSRVAAFRKAVPDLPQRTGVRGDAELDALLAARLLEVANEVRGDDAVTPELRRALEQLGLLAETPSGPALEKLVRDSNSLLDIHNWISRLTEIEARVCRISFETGSGLESRGTGFLVAPDVVLTNHHVIAPVLDEIAQTYQGKLKVCKLNIDENQETPPKYGVRGIPTLMLFKNGNVEATKVGALSKSQLAAFLDSNI